MKLLHTADWHLGRSLFGMPLLDDQRHLLLELVRVAAEERVDAVIVAGDIYDRAVPPAEAVELLDEILNRLVLDLRIQTILIAGNHDSPARLGFAGKLLRSSGLHVFGSLSREPTPVVLSDGHGPVAIYAIPYAEPPAARECLGDPEIHDHEAAFRAVVARFLDGRDPARRVLVAHAFVAGGAECESERPLSIGGASTVSPSCFDGFDYVALGHLHRPQTAGRETMRYPGSLMKYSLSETEHQKGVAIVELDGRGRVAVRTLALHPKRDFRLVEGRLDELLRAPPKGVNREDYLSVRLLDEGALYDPMGKLRAVYPNVVHLERPGLSAPAPKEGELARPASQKLSDEALFRAFWEEVTSEEFTAEHEEAVRLALRQIESELREDLGGEAK